MDPIKEFEKEKESNIEKLGKSKKLQKLGLEFLTASSEYQYSYNFSWLGRPIIQFPQDILALQEIIWQVKPDLIIETGIAHGGSIIFSASMMELLGGDGQVVGVDIDIRKHNRKEIENHPLFKRITLIEGSSIDTAVIEQVKKIAKNKKRILVTLDSNHAYPHVLKELELYSPFVSKGSYIVVFDTVAEFLPKKVLGKRTWGKGNSPLTAVNEFLKSNKDFVIDKKIENKLLITVAPSGYLMRIK